MVPGARRFAFAVLAAACSAGRAEDPLVAAVGAGVAAQLGIAPDRVVCGSDRCIVHVGGAHLGVTVTGAPEVSWQADEVVLAAPLAAHVATELADLGIAGRVDCGAPVQPLPVDGRLACHLEGGGVAWVRLGLDDRLELEVALTAEAAAGRTAPPDDVGLERLSRALDSDEAEGQAAPADDDDDRRAADAADAGVDAPAPRGPGG